MSSVVNLDFVRALVKLGHRAAGQKKFGDAQHFAQRGEELLKHWRAHEKRNAEIAASGGEGDRFEAERNDVEELTAELNAIKEKAR